VDARNKCTAVRFKFFCHYDGFYHLGTLAKIVMPGLVPGIHVFLLAFLKSWMPATSAGMTIKSRMTALSCNPND
jgi:hypothetical protein